ncbi:MAG TPA: hypothetical protein VEH27_02205 [Methylomirabilota bacterium]|nr:hypothetical protein [Methylomirabilota bacterium]
MNSNQNDKDLLRGFYVRPFSAINRGHADRAGVSLAFGLTRSALILLHPISPLFSAIPAYYRLFPA